MRYIWKPGTRGPMHYQLHDTFGDAWNQSLCGIVMTPHRTINPPFALGKGICKHCEAIAAGKRAVTDRRPQPEGSE